MNSRLRWRANASVAHAEVAYPAERCANGSLHTLENPCDSIPSAMFDSRRHVGERRPTAVSSTIAAGRAASSSRADMLVGDPRRRLAHRLGVLHHVALERREHRRLTPPGHLAGLGLVESLVVGLEVAEVEAPRAPDLRRHRHVGERLQVGVDLVPLLGLAAERHHALEHRPVVPHHLGRLGDLTEHLAAEPLHHVPVQPGDLAFGIRVVLDMFAPRVDGST